MNDEHASDDLSPAAADDNVGDEIDELLAEAVVYEAGMAPPVAQPVFASQPSRAPGRSAGTPEAPEPKVSVLFWAAAVVWNLPGGIGGWLILRKTHPRTARRVLLTGVISFVVLVALGAAFAIGTQLVYPSHITVKG